MNAKGGSPRFNSVLAVDNGTDPGGLGGTSTAKRTALQITLSGHL